MASVVRLCFLASSALPGAFDLFACFGRYRRLISSAASSHHDTSRALRRKRTSTVLPHPPRHKCCARLASPTSPSDHVPHFRPSCRYACAGHAGGHAGGHAVGQAARQPGKSGGPCPVPARSPGPLAGDRGLGKCPRQATVDGACAVT